MSLKSTFKLFSVIGVWVGLVGLLAIFLPVTPVSAGSNDCADELFISEYVEGTSNNKALEIYNGTDSTITLTGQYAVFLSYDGGPTPDTYSLIGSIASGDVFVFAHSTADPAILAVADQTTGGSLWNGNDFVALRKNGVTVDSIGQILVNPGTEWGTGLTSTADNTLRRQSAILTGDSTEGDSFDPAVQWEGFAIDTFSGLGSHDTVCTDQTITLDGTFNSNEWGQPLGEINNVQFAATWDANAWYFAANDTSGSGFSDTDFLMIGIDVDPEDEADATNSGGGLGDGNNGQFCGAHFPDENKPDYIARVRQNPYYIDVYQWNGSNWAEIFWSEGSFGNFDMSGNGNTYEVRINRAAEAADFVAGEPVGFYLWLTNTSCEYFNAWPPENENTYFAGSGTPGNGIFLFAHTRFESTDNGRLPTNYAAKIAWDTDNTIGTVGTHNFFATDDSSNPWLRFTTTAEDDNNCTVQARLRANNAFEQGTGNFAGINRYIQFTLTNCTGLNSTVQMRYETAELNGVMEDSTLEFFRCPEAVVCTGSWVAVEPAGFAYTRDAANNNLSVSNVTEANFSFWSIGNTTNAPTAVSFTTLTTHSTSILLPLAVFMLLLAITIFWFKRMQKG